jgi:glycosyltransferase involved in cell wall biosynthesis
MLEAIFTGYPRWKLRDEALPAEKIKTFPWFQTIYMGKGRFGIDSAWLDRELAWLSRETLDRYCAAKLPPCDVLIGLSGFALRSGRIAQARGGRFVCDRGSSHIRFQDRILREEFSRWGQHFPGIDPRTVAREEAEYEQADVITVPSQFALASFLACGVNKAKLRKTRYGVDLSRFRPAGEPANDRFDVLAVGQVSFRKGIPYLLDAFRQLKHPRKRLTIVGAMFPEIQTWLRGRKLDDVQFIGPKPQAELPGLMSRAHVFVLASIEEGLGLVLAQAMACGCPVIATENSGGPDLITEGVEGFIVPIRDPSAIAERLENLAQDAARRAVMSQACLERVRRCGGWNDYGESVALVCHELTN